MIYLGLGALGVLAVIGGVVLGVILPGSGGLFIAAAGALFAGLSAIGQLRERKTAARQLEEEKAAVELGERAQLRREEDLAKGPGIIQAGALRFVAVSLADTKYWREIQENTERPQVFPRKVDQYFCINIEEAFVYDPQLIFDITIVNKSSSQPYILREVGVRWTALCNIMYIYGVPEAAAIRPHGRYVITCHNEEFNEAMPPQGDDGTAGPIDSAIDKGIRLADPIYLEPHAPFRFTLELEDYAKAVPNHAQIRFWLRSDAGTDWSQELEIFTL